MTPQPNNLSNPNNLPVLLFDRDTGTALPLSLDILTVPGIVIAYHQNHFQQDDKDEDWLPVAGSWGWLVIGHDAKHHMESSELEIIKQYRMGCFYLWGAQATSWEKARCLLNAYEAVIHAITQTPRPFIYRILKSGELQTITIR